MPFVENTIYDVIVVGACMQCLALVVPRNLAVNLGEHVPASLDGRFSCITGPNPGVSTTSKHDEPCICSLTGDMLTP